jgi:hypothetical protein
VPVFDTVQLPEEAAVDYTLGNVQVSGSKKGERVIPSIPHISAHGSGSHNKRYLDRRHGREKQGD